MHNWVNISVWVQISINYININISYCAVIMIP
jgi:hypothetical protein